MKFANNLLHLYLRHFTYKDSLESLDLFIDSVLEQMDHRDLVEVLEECSREELEQIMRTYLYAHLSNGLKREFPANTHYQQGKISRKKLH